MSCPDTVNHLHCPHDLQSNLDLLPADQEVENEEFNHCDDMAIQAVTRAMRPHTGHVGNQTDTDRTRLRKAWSAKDGGSRAARMSRVSNQKTESIYLNRKLHDSKH